MKPDAAMQEGRKRPGRPLFLLGLLAAVSFLAYLAIAALSGHFAYGTPHARRPILAVLALLAVAFACYLLAIRLAVRNRDDRRLFWLILVSSLVFRVTLLGTWPIQEVDIYRYLWDGETVRAGVSPFRYTPEEVLAAPGGGNALPEDLRKLVELRESSPQLATILSRVHYGQVPTVYPPTSQAVFAFCSLLTPRDTGVLRRLVIMKTCFVAFDLATLLVVVGLLRFAGWHTGWSLVYGWCPLVIKEIANSGHLDAIAVLLTALAVLVSMRALFSRARQPDAAATGATVLAAVLLALGVGAKLFPLVIAPLLAAAWIVRLGWRRAVMPLAVFVAITAILLWPMLPAGTGNDPSRGLKTFFGQWEMNDFLFMLAVENLKPQDGVEPWFSVVPHAWRVALLHAPCAWLQRDQASTAFIATRCVMSVVFLVLLAYLVRLAVASRSRIGWLRAAMLCLAWFWLLAPTQNPWYWMWVLPLVPFARSRAWLAMSGLVLIYYTRFWLTYHWPAQPVPGSGYNGAQFFDFVLTWLEFAPWFAWLTVETMLRPGTVFRETQPSGRGVRSREGAGEWLARFHRSLLCVRFSVSGGKE